MWLFLFWSHKILFCLNCILSCSLCTSLFVGFAKSCWLSFVLFPYFELFFAFFVSSISRNFLSCQCAFWALFSFCVPLFLFCYYFAFFWTVMLSHNCFCPSNVALWRTNAQFALVIWIERITLFHIHFSLIIPIIVPLFVFFFVLLLCVHSLSFCFDNSFLLPLPFTLSFFFLSFLLIRTRIGIINPEFGLDSMS